MNRLMEADFFPRDSEVAREKPCILIIDNDRDFTHFTKVALEKTGNYSVCEENDANKAHQTAQAGPDPVGYCDARNRRRRSCGADSIGSTIAGNADYFSDSARHES